MKHLALSGASVSIPTASSILIFLMPIWGLLLTITAFVALDTAIGVYVSVKLNGWKSFQSTKLFNIAVKSFFYMGSIFLAFMLDTYVLVGTVHDVSLFISKCVTILWVFIEVKSIDESSIKLGNKPILNVIKGFINGAKDFKQDLNELQQ